MEAEVGGSAEPADEPATEPANEPADETTAEKALRTAAGPGALLDAERIEFFRRMRDDFTRFEMEYRWAVQEILTKVSILREEFLQLHRYNPIEHVNSRVKSPASILDKAARRGVPPSLPAIRKHITDIAGVRITCSFRADTYRMLETLTSQDDVRLIQVKDYIAEPKPNGYKSLHAIVEIPVFLSTGPVPVIVELQLRTIAMDFWASLEHKIFYKYDREVPGHLRDDLKQAADAAEQLDLRMEQLHHEVHGVHGRSDLPVGPDIDNDLLERLWQLSLETRPETG
nr:GTP pyrophosphokinase family protein [Kineosporia sp. NBRC 101677]